MQKSILEEVEEDLELVKKALSKEEEDVQKEEKEELQLKGRKEKQMDEKQMEEKQMEEKQKEEKQMEEKQLEVGEKKDRQSEQNHAEAVLKKDDSVPTASRREEPVDQGNQGMAEFADRMSRIEIADTCEMDSWTAVVLKQSAQKIQAAGENQSAVEELKSSSSSSSKEMNCNECKLKRDDDLNFDDFFNQMLLEEKQYLNDNQIAPTRLVFDKGY